MRLEKYHPVILQPPAEAMSSKFVFDSLRMHLKARCMKYADVAKALRISEATVKRVFATKNCTIERLDAMCDLVQVEMAELTRGMPREKRLVACLTRDQEEKVASDLALLIVAICALQQLRASEIVELFALDQAQCIRLRLRLERIGLLELHENNRIRLRVARTYARGSPRFSRPCGALHRAALVFVGIRPPAVECPRSPGCPCARFRTSSKTTARGPNAFDEAIPISSPAFRGSSGPAISGSDAPTAACRPTRSWTSRRANSSYTATSPMSSFTAISTACP
jgi:AcrR family transcriptional regulator